MANAISGFDGYNVYKHNEDETVTKMNQTLITEATQFSVGQLDPDTDYSGVFEVRPVDKAGNETNPGFFVTTGAPGVTGEPKTLNPTPEQAPMALEDTQKIDTLVQQCMAAHDPATGVTIGIVSPKGYYYKAYGTNTGVNLYYRTASQTKMFTGTVILMMIDKGLLTLDNHLSDYLDGYAVDPTIRQMLMMRSGVYDYELNSTLGQNFTLNPASAYTVDQVIGVIQAGGKMFDPDTAFYYTNSNFYLLAKIAEKLDPAQRTIDVIFKEDIFNPLGMANTYLQTATGLPTSPYAVGQDFDPILTAILGWLFGATAFRRDVSNQNPAYVWASGAIISQINDMIKWGKELCDNTLLSPEMHQVRMDTYSTQSSSPAYGLTAEGPSLYNYCLALIQVGSWFGHDGSWLGYDSTTMYEPHTGTVVSVYENFQTTPANSMGTLLALTTIWYEIARYLLPGSPDQPGYMSGEAATGTGHSVLPKLISDGTGNIYLPNEFQPITELYTDGALASVTGAAVPAGLQEGAYVKGIAAGQRGYNGVNAVYNVAGGQGGTGGSGFDEIFIPKELLGATFDAIYGIPGTGSGAPGGDTIFRSGDVAITAPGGKNGVANALPTATGVDGLVGYPGAAPGADSTGMAGAGGGRGGSSGNTGGLTTGQKGGNSATIAGPNCPNSAQDAEDLVGGAGGAGGYGLGAYTNATIGPGGNGGKYGGGGGGAGSAWGNGYGATPGSPGVGGLQIRWV